MSQYIKDMGPGLIELVLKPSLNTPSGEPSEISREKSMSQSCTALVHVLVCSTHGAGHAGSLEHCLQQLLVTLGQLRGLCWSDNTFSKHRLEEAVTACDVACIHISL